MKQVFKAVLAAGMIAGLTSAAYADKLPRGAKPATPQKVASAYAGRTDLWEDNCDGGVYFAPNWQARAWCADNAENLGAGKWAVEDNGDLCHDLTWYWPNGNGAGSSKGDRACISHAVDQFGGLWRSWPGDSEWWRVKRPSAPVRGYKFQSEVLQARSNLGL